jgi:metal-responsive CopG/Arc/MetJ family transcriptional regulator
MPRDRAIDDGRRSIEVLLPLHLVNAVDRLRYDHPYWSRSAVIAEAIEEYLVRRNELFPTSS